MLAAVFALVEWVEENLNRSLSRFLVLATGLAALLAVTAPLLRGDGVDPIPHVFVAVGVAALFVALDHLIAPLKRRAEDRHPA
jgi:hypothetical protein